MARANIKTAFALTLELNEDEAKTLVAILRHVGGSPLLSRRRHVAAAVLEAVIGATNWDSNDVEPGCDLHGTLGFGDRA